MDTVDIEFIDISVGLCDDTIELLLLVAACSVSKIFYNAINKYSDYLFTMFLTQMPDLTNAKAMRHFMISVALIMATIKMMEMPVK